MDSAIKILITVVIGALVLGGIYAFWQLIIMPTTEERVKDMFDYSARL